MGLKDFLKKQFIDVIQWTESAMGFCPIGIPCRISKSSMAPI